MPMSDHELGRLLGNLEQQNKAAEQSRNIIHEKIEGQGKVLNETLLAIQSLQQDHDAIKAKLATEVVPHVNDFRRFKWAGLGVLAVLSVIGGNVGAALPKILQFFTKGP